MTQVSGGDLYHYTHTAYCAPLFAQPLMNYSQSSPTHTIASDINMYSMLFATQLNLGTFQQPIYLGFCISWPNL